LHVLPFRYTCIADYLQLDNYIKEYTCIADYLCFIQVFTESWPLIQYSSLTIFLQFCRIREVAEKISHHGFNSPPAFSALTNVTVTQCAVGPNCLAFLLEVGGGGNLSTHSFL
jgi:hypothetical protein